MRIIVVMLVMHATTASADGNWIAGPVHDAIEQVDSELAFRGLGMFGGALFMRGTHTAGPMIGIDSQTLPKRGLHVVGAFDLQFGDAGGFQGEVRLGGGAGVDSERLFIHVIGGVNAGAIGPAGAVGGYAQIAGGLHLKALVISGAWMRTRALIDSDQNRFYFRVGLPTVSLIVGAQLGEYMPSRDMPTDGRSSSLPIYLGMESF